MKVFVALFSALALAAAPAAMAQLHEGDVEVSIVGGKLVVDGHAVVEAGTGYKVFEGDFGDLAGGPFSTDDPGYDSMPGTFAAGTILQYAALGTLRFWNGGAWVTTPSLPGNAERVAIAGNGGESTLWTFGGVTGSLSGLIGQAGANGNIHEHLDMTVSREGGGAPAVGAYLIQLALTSSGLVDSDPFYIVLNRGLDDDAFETAVQALAVPEPGRLALLVAGLAVVGAIARRRR